MPTETVDPRHADIATRPLAEAVFAMWEGQSGASGDGEASTNGEGTGEMQPFDPPGWLGAARTERAMQEPERSDVWGS